MGEMIEIDRDELRDMRVDLRHAAELLAEAEPSTDMDNSRCRDWIDAVNEWLEMYGSTYSSNDGEAK